MPVRRPTSLLVAVWLAGVGLATGTGVLAVQLVAQQVGDPSVAVLSAADVGRQLASTPTGSTPDSGRSDASTNKPQTSAAEPAETGTAGEPAEHAKTTASAPIKHHEGSTTPAGTASRAAETHHDGTGDKPASTPANAGSTAATSDVKAFDSQGGSVGVRCRGTAPEQVYASPAQGYRVDESSVSGSTLEVRFESSTTDVRMKVSCSSGSPVLTENRADPRDDSATESGTSGSGGGSVGSSSDGSVDGTGENK
jgi:hypothetical protein